MMVDKYVFDLIDNLAEHEVMVLLAIARKKYNEELKSEQVVFREVITKETFERKYKKLVTLIKHYPSEARPEDYSLYMTYNPRDTIKGLFMLKNRINSWLYESVKSGKNTSLYIHLRKLDREFVSCLQKPECVSRKLHFLIDVDDLEKLNDVYSQIEDLGLEVCHETRTKNGMHILVKPFNISLWKEIENVEIKRDGLFHLWHFGDER